MSADERREGVDLLQRDPVLLLAEVDIGARVGPGFGHGEPRSGSRTGGLPIGQRARVRRIEGRRGAKRHDAERQEHGARQG